MNYVDAARIASPVIADHLKTPTGQIRLGVLRRGLAMEIAHPGMRLTRKAVKCSTILRREFGLSGTPAKLLVLFDKLLESAGLDFSKPGPLVGVTP